MNLEQVTLTTPLSLKARLANFNINATSSSAYPKTDPDLGLDLVKLENTLAVNMSLLGQGPEILKEIKLTPVYIPKPFVPIHCYPKLTFPKDYYFIRTKLRLGDIRKPAAEALKILCSLTLYVPKWYSETVGQLEWHYLGSRRHMNNFGYTLLSFIPLFSGLAFWRLGKILQQIEVQNNYELTRPLAIGVLGIFSPLALLVIQRRLNLHWKLHVKSFLSA